MKNEEVQWDDLYDIWKESANTRDIHIKMSELVDDFKSKVSHFEKDTIKRDLAALKANWDNFKSKTSQFEKNSIDKDLTFFRKLLKKFLRFLNRKG